MLDMVCLCIHNHICDISNYVDMQGMPPATLPDIESEIYVLLFQKKQSIWFKAIKSAVHVYSEFCVLN